MTEAKHTPGPSPYAAAIARFAEDGDLCETLRDQNNWGTVSVDEDGIWWHADVNPNDTGWNLATWAQLDAAISKATGEGN
jgi:hypothetical protein